jgi:hypothetical protein
MRFHASAAATTDDDLVMLNISPRLPDVGDSINNVDDVALFKAQWPALTPALVDQYTEPPQGVGRKVRLTIMTVDDVVGGLDEIDWTILARNVGHPQFSVAGVILYRHAIAEEARAWLDTTGLFHTPISKWESIYKAYLVDVNRFNLVDASKARDWNVCCANATRKLLTLTGRDLEPADYEADYNNTKAGSTYHFAPDPNSVQLSSAMWDQTLHATLKDTVKTIIGQVEELSNPVDIERWWQERWGWNPSGSSSLRHRLQGLKDIDERLHSSSRPNKRTVAEALDLQEILDMLGGKPTGIARVSTKPEPGYKRRTLYAIDDHSHYIASYASMDMEKYMNIGGMVAKQTPEDVLEWYLTDLYARTTGKSVWLSLDYSDFNKDHDRRHLALLNYTLGKEWLALAKRNALWSKAAMMKAACAYNTALEHLNAWVRMPDGEYRRHYNGLWSGHRDTARDNTILHYAYSTSISHLLQLTTGLKARDKYIGICGDDEDALHASWCHAAGYVGMHSVCNFKINYIKQRCSRKYHEFLQRFADGHNLPYRPLANVIAALSTGSWYKPSLLRLDSAAQELTTNCTELVARGAPAQLARRLAYKMLDAIYTIETISADGSQTRMRLDWWPVRNGGVGRASALWGIKDPDMELQWEKPILHLPKEAPEKASQDWLESKWQWAQALQPGQLAAYKQHLLRENYKSLYGDYLTSQSLHCNIGVLKTINDTERRARNSRLNALPEPKLHQATPALKIQLAQTTSIRQPLTHERLLSRFHIDSQLFSFLGGWDGVLKQCPAAELAKYTYIPKAAEIKQPMLDTMEPALANKLKQRNLPLM